MSLMYIVEGVKLAIVHQLKSHISNIMANMEQKPWTAIVNISIF